MTTSGYIIITVLFILTIIARILSNNEEDLKLGCDIIMAVLTVIALLTL